MHTAIRYGSQSLSLALEADQRISVHRGPAPLADPAAALRAALDAPFQFPPLRQALTPEDRVALVVDANLDNASLITPVMDYLREVGLAPENITLVDAPTDESHSYLASTKAGRRVYLHRAVGEADAVVTLSRRRFSSAGHEGAEASIFPALSDKETRDSPVVAGESQEVGYLLGLPFHIQLIDAAGGGISQVVAGASEAAREAEQILSHRWGIVLPRRADTVVASVSTPSFAALVRAAALADLLPPNGRLILLVDGAFDAPLLPQATDADAALALLEKHASPGAALAQEWLRAASHARISLLSGTPRSVIEELYASALDGPEQVQRLVARSGDCVLIEDADRFSAKVG